MIDAEDIPDWAEDEADPFLGITCQIVHATGKAYLIRTKSGKEAWLPMSQVQLLDDREDDWRVFAVPEWLCREKGIIGGRLD